MKPKATSTPRPTVAILFSRVSTTRQADEGHGLDAQEAMTRAYAKMRGWPVVEVIREEGVSGTLPEANRPVLQQLKARVALLKEQGNDPMVLIYSFSRLSRDRDLFLKLVGKDALPICSMNENVDLSTPMGQFFMVVMAGLNELESKQTQKRTKDALAAAKAKGVKLGQKPAAVLAPDTVNLVKELYLTGQYTQQSLADELTRRGVKTPGGSDKWWKRQVQICLAAET